MAVNNASGKLRVNDVVKYNLDNQRSYVPVAQIHPWVAEWYHACSENSDPRDLRAGARSKGNGVHCR